MDSVRIIYLLTDLFNLPPSFCLEGYGPSRFEGRHSKRKYIVGRLMLMIMSAREPRAVRIRFMNGSVVVAIMLKGVSFGSAGRRMANIMFFVMTPGVLIPSAVIIGRYMGPTVFVMFSADMFIPNLFRMPGFAAIRPGSTGK